MSTLPSGRRVLCSARFEPMSSVTVNDPPAIAAGDRERECEQRNAGDAAREAQRMTHGHSST